MANDFDRFPLEDILVKSGSLKMSDVWVLSMSTFFQNLVSYLTSFGVLLPQLTTTQRNNITSPSRGQLIYNITTDAPEIWQVKAGVGAWRQITTTP